MAVKPFSLYRFLLPLVCLSASLAVVAADTAPEPEATASPRPGGGKGVSVDVNGRELPVEPVADRPLAPGEPPGASSSTLSPANQSQAGVGLKIRFGQGAKETGNEQKADVEPRAK